MITYHFFHNYKSINNYHFLLPLFLAFVLCFISNNSYAAKKWSRSEIIEDSIAHTKQVHKMRYQMHLIHLSINEAIFQIHQKHGRKSLKWPDSSVLFELYSDYDEVTDTYTPKPRPNTKAVPLEEFETGKYCITQGCVKTIQAANANKKAAAYHFFFSSKNAQLYLVTKLREYAEIGIEVALYNKLHKRYYDYKKSTDKYFDERKKFTIKRNKSAQKQARRRAKESDNYFGEFMEVFAQGMQQGSLTYLQQEEQRIAKEKQAQRELEMAQYKYSKMAAKKENDASQESSSKEQRSNRQASPLPRADWSARRKEIGAERMRLYKELGHAHHEQFLETGLSKKGESCTKARNCDLGGQNEIGRKRPDFLDDKISLQMWETTQNKIDDVLRKIKDIDQKLKAHEANLPK